MEGTPVRFGNIEGDVIGGIVEGSGNIFGKSITININILSKETQSLLQQVKNISDKELEIQGSAKKDDEKINNLQDLNGMEVVTKKFLSALKSKEEETGLRVEQVRTNDNLQFSRDELLIKEALIEGNNYRVMGKYKEAISCYDRILLLNPNHHVALNNKAFILYKMGSHNEALFYLDKVLSINPNDAIALNNKGLALSNLDRYKEAIEHFDKALELKTDYVKVLYNKANALIKLGRSNIYQMRSLTKKAIICYDKIIEINPNHVNAWIDKGVALFYTFKRIEEAIACYDRVLDINPNHAMAWYYKGSALDALGRGKDAKKYWKKAGELDNRLR